MCGDFNLDSLRLRLLPESSVFESRETNLPTAAVAIIIDPKDQNGWVLLIKRTERKGDPWSGQVAFPGGHRSLEDRTLLETAVREAREEVGIDLHRHNMLGVLPPVHTHTRRVVVAPFVFQLKTKATVALNEEIAESFWAPFSELKQIEASKTMVHVEEGTLTVDSYIYRSHVIWGLTFRIINILLNKYQGNGP